MFTDSAQGTSDTCIKKKSRRRSLRNFRCSLSTYGSADGILRSVSLSDTEYGSVWLTEHELENRPQLQTVPPSSTDSPCLHVSAGIEDIWSDVTSILPDTPEVVRSGVFIEPSLTATPVLNSQSEPESACMWDQAKEDCFQDQFSHLPSLEKNVSLEIKTLPLMRMIYIQPESETDGNTSTTIVRNASHMCFITFELESPQIPFPPLPDENGAQQNGGTLLACNQGESIEVLDSVTQLPDAETPLNAANLVMPGFTPSVPEDSPHCGTSFNEYKKFKENRKTRKERRRSMMGSELMLDMYTEETSMEDVLKKTEDSEPVEIPHPSKCDSLLDTMANANHENEGTVDAHTHSKPNRKKRRSVDVAIVEAGLRADWSSEQDNLTNFETSPSSATSTSERSSLRLYRHRSVKLALSEASNVNRDGHDPIKSSKSGNWKEFTESDSIKSQSDNCAVISDGNERTRIACSVDIVEKEDSEEIGLLPEVENLYQNKPYKKPEIRTWETIFEHPSKGKLTSKQKFCRCLQFKDIPKSKLKHRLKKAALNGWHMNNVDKVTDGELIQRLETLEKDMNYP